MTKARHKESQVIRFRVREISITGKSTEIESSLVVVWDNGEGVVGSDCFMGTGFPLRVMKTFWKVKVVMVAEHCECA